MKRKFEVLTGGSYEDEHKRKFKKGSVVETTKDLVGLFPNAFKEVLTYPAVTASAPVEEDEAPKDKEAPTPPDDPGETDPPVETDKGVEKTEDFPKAKEQGFKVFSRGRNQYFVVDEDGDVNKEPLGKKDVIPFIDKED